MNSRDYDGCSALHYAAGEGHRNIIEILLDNGADANATQSDG
jgi:ankyrin repeat protein